MNRYRFPTARAAVIRETLSKSMRIAKRYRFPTAWVAEIRETFSNCMRFAKRFRLPTSWVEVILKTFSKSMRIANRHKILVGSAAGILCLAVLAKSSFVTSVTGVQVTTRTWEGTWNNLKHTSDGPLKCVATEVESGLWEATFTGVFQGDPFSYDATFQARPGRQGSFDLSGTSIIRDHEYQWTGMMRGQELTGRYNSTDGSDGEFVLQAE